MLMMQAQKLQAAAQRTATSSTTMTIIMIIMMTIIMTATNALLTASMTVASSCIMMTAEGKCRGVRLRPPAAALRLAALVHRSGALPQSPIDAAVLLLRLPLQLLQLVQQLYQEPLLVLVLLGAVAVLESS